MKLSGKAVGEVLAALGVMASLVFVGLEVRQNTIAARAAAYQEIGFHTANLWSEAARDPDWLELNVWAEDPSRWNEIDDVGWSQLAAGMTAGMRGWETIYLQVQSGLLPSDAMTRLGYGLNYWPNSFERLWAVVRDRMDPEFAAYVDREYGYSPSG